jgi:MFS family permease
MVNMSHTPNLCERRDPHRWVIFGVFAGIYFFVYFHRVSTAVIVPDLLAAFATDATALGMMSSMYFYIYAFEQPLVGYLADRIGPRRVVGLWSIAAAAGCVLFGLAPNIAWASVARALIGFGVGGVYVPTIKAFSQWFRRQEFATMLGLLMAVGNLGAVVATTPLAWMAGAWGWRTAFFTIGAITMALGLLALATTQDHDGRGVVKGAGGGARCRPRPPTVTLQTVWQVLASARCWLVAIIFFGVYGTLVTFQGLWATPFLMTALKVERLSASNLTMLIAIGVILGSPSLGWLGDRLVWRKADAVVVCLFIYTLIWGGILFGYRPLGLTGMSLLLLALGIVSGGFLSFLWAFVRETTPPEILGLTSGILNPAPFLGVAAFQTITGTILNRTERIGTDYSIQGYEDALLACLSGIVVCLGLALLLRKIRTEA